MGAAPDAMPSTTIKVLVTGPYNAGKTTLVSTISEIPVVMTETSASDEAGAGATTTVAFDFGVFSVADDAGMIELCLFGTPGQDRFSFFWEILAKSMLGFILMVDATDESTWRNAREILDFYQRLADVPYVVGANRTSGQRQAARLRRALQLTDEVDVVPCQATDRRSAAQLVLVLLRRVLTQVQTAPTAAAPAS